MTTSLTLYPGQYFDAETDLHQNYFRDYDPRTGRYVQSDPLRLMGGMNLFSYAADNPIMFIDRRGLKTCCPKDEKGTIEARIGAVKIILSNLSKGQLPGGTVYGTTYCMPWGPGTPQIYQYLSPCVRDCVLVHENVHVRQCKDSFWAYYSTKEIERERPAYKAELACLLSYRGLYDEKCCEE